MNGMNQAIDPGMSGRNMLNETDKNADSRTFSYAKIYSFDWRALR